MPFVDPNFYKDQFGVEGKHVILTFGLLSPNKGIEYMLRFPPVLRDFPNLVYVVLAPRIPTCSASRERRIVFPWRVWPRTSGSPRMSCSTTVSSNSAS